MLAEVFFLSSRGDVLASRHYRCIGENSSPDAFFNEVRENPSSGPVVTIGDSHYLYLHHRGMYVVSVSQENVAPSLVFEFLRTLVKLIKDFCGVFGEAAIRRNFILVHEILDEVIDAGYIQTTDVGQLVGRVKSPAAPMPELGPCPRSAASIVGNLGQNLQQMVGMKTLPSSAALRPLAHGTSSRQDEFFVDIFENVTCVLNFLGRPVRMSLVGSVQMKAFIQTNQQMSLALSDSISVVSGDGVTTANHFGNSATPDIVLEDTSFHAGVNLAHWGAQRVLTFCPPQGEFSLLQYRMSQLQCPPPFILLPAISAQRSDRLELTVTLRSTLPDSTYGINIVLGTTLPADTGLASTGPLVEGQAVDFDRSSRELLWKVGRLRGGHSCMLHAKLDVAKPSMAEQAQRLMGPFSLTFEVPMFTLSGIAVKHLRWAHQPQTASAQRWVRYVTQSGSYMCRAS